MLGASHCKSGLNPECIACLHGQMSVSLDSTCHASSNRASDCNVDVQPASTARSKAALRLWGRVKCKSFWGLPFCGVFSGVQSVGDIRSSLELVVELLAGQC